MDAEEEVQRRSRGAYQGDPLWRRLAYMRIDADGAVLTFTLRLAREQGWTAAYAEAVVAEYRRFLYLAGRASSPVTPSPAVDRAWHLHLTYSLHYWSELCGKVLRRELHHDPGRGGADEVDGLRTQYAATLAIYERTFGCRPPPNVWPPVTSLLPEDPASESHAGPILAAAICLTIAGVTLLGAGPPSPDVPLLRMWIFMTATAGFFISIWWIARERFLAEVGCAIEGAGCAGCGG